MIKRFLAALAVLVSAVTFANAQIPGNFNPGTVFGNPTASAAPGRVMTASEWLDRWCSASAGSVINRQVAGWVCTTTPAFAVAGTPATPSAGFVTVWADSVSKNFKMINDAGTSATMVVPDTGAANNFLTAIAGTGIISKAQPSFSNLSGSATCPQLPAQTGDVTTSAGSCATTLVTSTNATGVLFTNIAAPATPSAGTTRVYVDSTSKNLNMKNDAGAVASMVVPSSAVSNQFLTGIVSAGTVTRAQPAFTDISGTAQVGQGGTGITSGTSGGILYFSGTSTIASSALLTSNGIVLGGGAGVAPTSTAAMTNGQLLVGQTAAAPLPKTITGDVTISAAGATTLANIPNDAPAAGDILFTNTAAPGTPAAGKVRVFTDSTSKTARMINDAGTLASMVVADTGASNNFLTAVSTAGVISKAQPTQDNISGFVVPPQGRLTLTTATPVITSSVSTATTIFYDCYLGNRVPYYNGSTDLYDTIASCEVSTALQAASTGVINSGGVFDVWWVHSGANRICVATNGSGGGWASDTAGSNTARGTGYTQLDRTTRPFITNKNAITNCYNGSTNYGSVSANQATYLGTFFTVSAGTTSYVFGGSSAGGTAAQFYLWNMYHRVDVTTTVTDSTASWTYSTATARSANNSTGNRISFVMGLAEDGIDVTHNATPAANVVSATGRAGMALDATNALDKQATYIAPTAATTAVLSLAPSNTYLPQLGSHFVQATEIGDGTNTITWNGAANQGLSARLRM